MKRVLTRAQTEPLLAASVILLFVIAYAVVGYLSVDPASRRVPLLTGGVTSLLIVVEILRQCLKKNAGAKEAKGDSSDAHAPATTLRGEATVLLSIAGVVTGIYLLGFLIAIPFYLVAAITLLGRRPVRTAVITAALTAIAIYVAFEVLLSYRLFAGVLFS
jgi:hypothetical protein